MGKLAVGKHQNRDEHQGIGPAGVSLSEIRPRMRRIWGFESEDVATAEWEAQDRSPSARPS